MPAPFIDQQQDPFVAALGNSDILNSDTPQGQTMANQQSQSDPFIGAVGGNVPQQTPQGVNSSEQDLGDQSYDDFCEEFAEKQLGLPNMGTNATQAWQNWSNQGKATTDFSQAKPGSLIYFQPDDSNGNNGHVGIYVGNGQMVSATYNGVQQDNLSDWINTTGQTPLGIVNP